MALSWRAALSSFDRVCMSSYTSGAVPTDGMTALFVEGATFLQKPYTRAELMQAVQGDGEAAEKHSG